jgi:hypothetical protein
MAKRKLTKDRQYHGLRGPWYCLSFQFPFVHYIVCL